MNETPNVGEKAPQFTLLDAEGDEVSLADEQGKVTILYFYPKDDTPGCTKEACSFRDVNKEIQQQGAQILGVSADGVESHRKFAQKNNLNFPLLADEGAAVSEAYGVWGERKMGDRTFMGITRTTFAIDEDGKIAKIWKVSDAENHGAEVLDWLKSRAS